MFGAVVNVLQDLGFTVDSADMQSGFVTAESATVNKTDFLDFLGSSEGSGNTKATVFIESMPGGITRVRLAFLAIKTTSGTYGQGARADRQILDPRLFQRAFSRIDAAVLERGGGLTGGVGAAQGDITPIGAVGAPLSATSALSRDALLAAAKHELESEGFTFLRDDETGGSLVTAPQGARLTVDDADCGKMFGISYLRDKRASTDVQYFIDVADRTITVRTAIDGLYRAGYGNADQTLTCTSRGVIEAQLLAKVVGAGGGK